MSALNRLRTFLGALPTAAIAAGLLTTCGPPAERPDCFKPSGRTATEYRRLAPFSTIEVNDNVEVALAADGQPYGVTLTAPRNLLAQINTDVRPTPGGSGRHTLVISNANRCNWVRNQSRPLRLTVHLPDSAARRPLYLHHRGEEPLTTAAPGTRLDTVFLYSTNIGDTDLDLNSTFLFLDSYEYGDVRLRGRTHDLRSTMSAIGQLRAEALDCEYAYVTSYRDAELHVRARSGLGITLNGNANAYWYGNPIWKDFREQAAGRVRRGGD